MAGAASTGSVDSVRVVLVDDEALIRAGLRMLLDAEPGIEVVGEASDGQAAIDLVARAKPAVVVMDVRMAGIDGVAATRTLASEEFSRATGARAEVLILTTFSDDDAVRDAIRAGAAGFILKSSAPAVLPAAIRALASGEGWLDPAITRALLNEYASSPELSLPAAAALHQLTPREREVLAAIATGRTNPQIAADLFLSEATVKTHVHRIFIKLGLNDRAQAVAFAFRTGIVRAGPVERGAAPQ
ncbi:MULTISPECIES: response regulator transcription factor [unclassified Microbacterium]|uniref:response regulator n=1 Tax=unclassified Microbacterium TaxID=2609290 RepID=UPI00214AADB3|nr:MULTISPECIES: response regulator transcription factor [unclassified Microbacterium]MCR2784399.1 response regulator transcription factor [Microbacterium sp. zg.B96]MDL5350691.1 response regulator transcription factor [Microbacterium sp. zg-YB36]WIM14783.1 response regulator transcription factor [Microbacterium sp. zg-B96]